MSTEVVLAIDIGSSSVRCVAYTRTGKNSVSAIHGGSSSIKIKSVEPNTGKIRLGMISNSSITSSNSNSKKSQQHELGSNGTSNPSSPTSSPLLSSSLLSNSSATSSTSSSTSSSSTSSSTSASVSSSLLSSSLLGSIDACVDNVLKKLRHKQQQQQQAYSSSGASASSASIQPSFQVVAVGFSCFVMNLIAIDKHGNLLGDEFSISYGCNTPEVVRECQRIRQELLSSSSSSKKDGGIDNRPTTTTATTIQSSSSSNINDTNNAIDELYQATGAPIHSAYALAQLRVLYQKHPEQVKRIYKWQTIPGLCLARWTGRTVIPMSYSEASWTGLLNFKHCAYEFAATELLPKGCLATLPPLADFKEALPGIMATKYDDDNSVNYYYNNNSNSTAAAAAAARRKQGEINTATTSTTTSAITTPTASTSTSTTRNEYWNRWPELRNAPLFLGIGDGAAANIGSKCCTDSRIAVTIGTSAAARICIRQGLGPFCTTKVPKGLFCYRIDTSNLLLGGALTDGGSVIEWAAELLNLNTEKAFLQCVDQAEELANRDYNGFNTVAAATTTDDDEKNNKNTTTITKEQEFQHPPVTMLPFLSGERSTGYRSGATGAIMGMTLGTTPGHVFKACLEGVSLRLRAILNLIQDSASTEVSPVILASGGALESNSMWRQMIADSSGLKVILDLDTSEGTSRGVARLVSNALASRTAATASSSLLLSQNGIDKKTASTKNMSTTIPTTSAALVGYLPEEDIVRFKEATPKPSAMAYFNKVAAFQEAFLKVMTPLYNQHGFASSS